MITSLLHLPGGCTYFLLRFSTSCQLLTFLLIHECICIGLLFFLLRFMAGFQYLALGDWGIKSDAAISRTENIKLFIFTCRLYGFIINLLGTLICVITQEYLRTIQYETIETTARGIVRYAYFFQLADYTAITATFLLALASSGLLWNETVPIPLAITTYIITSVCGLAFLYTFSVMVVRRQTSRLIYNDPNFIAARKKQ